MKTNIVKLMTLKSKSNQYNFRNNAFINLYLKFALFLFVNGMSTLCLAQTDSIDNPPPGFCGTTIQNIMKYNEAYHDALYPSQQFLPSLLPDFTLQDSFPQNEIIRCGNFRLYYADFLYSPLEGFADNSFGSTRRNTLCEVLNYVSSIINISPDDSLDLFICKSGTASSPAPIGRSYLNIGGPFFPDSTFSYLQGIYGGNLYNHIITGTDPDILNYDGFIGINYVYNNGTGVYVYNFGNDTSERQCGSYDLYSVLLHSITHALGWVSGIKDDVNIPHYPEAYNNSFTVLDSLYFYYESTPVLNNFEKMVVFNNLNQPGINPNIASTANILRTNKIWLTNDGAPLNQPISDFIEPKGDTLFGISLSHMLAENLSFTKRAQYSPGYQPNYVMGRTISPYQLRRSFTLPELRVLKTLGYRWNSSFKFATNLNGHDTNYRLILNHPPYRTFYKLPITSLYSIDTIFPDTSYRDIEVVNYNTAADSNNTVIQIDILNNPKYSDLDSDSVKIYPGSVFGIRGVSKNGNNHDRLIVGTNNETIFYTPPPYYVGRSQFGFYLWDGHEKGAFIVYTIDLLAGTDSLIPDKELIINGNFEDGTEVKQRNNSNINKPYSSRYIGEYEGEYFGGYHFSGAHPLGYVSWFSNPPQGQGDLIANSYMTCDLADSMSLIKQFGSIKNNNSTCITTMNLSRIPLPRSQSASNERFHRLTRNSLYYDYNFSTLTDSVRACKKYLFQCDLHFPKLFFGTGYSPGENLTFIIEFTSNPLPGFYNNFVTYESKKITIPVVPANLLNCDTNWVHVLDTISYCNQTPAKYLRIRNFNPYIISQPTNFNFEFIDNISLKLLSSPPMSINIQASSDSICPGFHDTLNVLAYDTICPLHYHWSTGDTTASIIVNPLSSSTYFVSITNGCSTLIDSISIKVGPGPVVTASYSEPACSGGPLFLYSNGGVTYQWSGPSGFNSIDKEPVFQPLTMNHTGNYSVTVTDTNFCQNVASVFVEVLSSPMATASSSTPCFQHPLELFASGGSYFLWLGPNNFVSSDQNPVLVTPDTSANGTYVVYVMDKIGCSDSALVNILLTNCCYDSTFLIIEDALSSQVTLTGNKIVVKGTLTINSPFAINQSEILMMTGAKIEVLNGMQLVIVNSHVHGCDSLWNSIIVNPGASLRLINDTIEDATYAVTAMPQSKIWINNNHFYKNYVGLYLPEPIPYNNTTTLSFLDFSGNELDGEGASLMPSDSGQLSLSSYAGALIYSQTAISPFGNDLNFYHHLEYGIKAYNSNITIRNSKFYNIGNSLKKGAGIYAEGYERPYQLSQAGFGISGNISFRSCDIGIMTNRMNEDIRDNFMKDITTYGVMIESGLYSYCTIENNTIQAKGLGIFMFMNQPMYECEISKNNISINAGHPKAYGGIVDYEFANTVGALGYYKIHDNTLDIDTGYYGIRLMNGKEQHVFENIITLHSPTSNLYGISTENCSHANIYCNFIGGQSNTVGDLTFHNPKGLRSSFTSASKFSCNYFYNLLTGASFENNNFNDSIRGNVFNTQYWGLRYDANAITGPQNHMGNKWIGNFTGWGAIHEGNTNLIFSSLFRTSITPNYYSPPTVSANAPWFFPIDSTEYACLICSNPDSLGTNSDNLSLLDRSIAKGDSINQDYPLEVKWLSSRFLYNKLGKNIELIDNDTVMQHFYDTIQNASAGKYQKLDGQIQEAFVIQPVVKNFLDSLSQQITQVLMLISFKDSLLQSNPSTTDSTQFCNDKQILVTLLDELVSQHMVAMQVINNSIQEKVSLSITENEVLPIVEIFEQNERIINDIYLNSIAKGIFLFSPSQEDEIRSIASQCPLTGGTAVFKARGIYSLISDSIFNDDMICLQATLKHEKAPESFDNQKRNFEIYPNPASNQVTIEWNNPIVEQVTLSIIDALGQPIQQICFNLKENSCLFKIKNLIPGVYQFCIRSTDGNLFCKKLVIIK